MQAISVGTQPLNLGRSLSTQPPSPPAELDPTVCQLFNVQSGGAYELGLPDAAQRGTFFTGIAEVS